MMRRDKTLNIWVLMIVLGVIVSFAYIYNSYVIQAVTDAAYNDRKFLQDYNTEIIEQLVSQESEENWDDIIKQYGVESCSPQISISGNRRIIPGNYDPMSRECFSCSEYLVDRWGTYQIVGSVTFDGVTKNISPKNIYITGLPYSVSFYGRNSAPSGWTVGGTISWTGYGWNSGDTDDYLRLRGNNDYANRGYAMSPMFETPSTLNVQTELDCFYYSSTVNQKSTIYVNANSASHPATTTNATTIQTRAKFNDFDHIENVRNNTTLTSSKPCITITHDVRSSSIETQFFGLKFLTVLYR
jgi:hypothetical protein